MLHLPARNIFGVRRVCKTVANVITTSPSIQEKTFKRLSRTPKDKWVVLKSPRYGLPVGASTPSTSIHGPEDPVRESDDVTIYTPATVNPILPFKAFIAREYWPNRTFTKLSFTLWFEGERAWYCNMEEDSYLDTYVSDPQPRSVDVRFNYHLRPRGKRAYQSLFASRRATSDRVSTFRDMLTMAVNMEGYIEHSTKTATSTGEKKRLLKHSRISMDSAVREFRELHGEGTVKAEIELTLCDLISPKNEHDRWPDIDSDYSFALVAPRVSQH